MRVAFSVESLSRPILPICQTLFRISPISPMCSFSRDARIIPCFRPLSRLFFAHHFFPPLRLRQQLRELRSRRRRARARTVTTRSASSWTRRRMGAVSRGAATLIWRRAPGRLSTFRHKSRASCARVSRKSHTRLTPVSRKSHTSLTCGVHTSHTRTLSRTRQRRK